MQHRFVAWLSGIALMTMAPFPAYAHGAPHSSPYLATPTIFWLANSVPTSSDIAMSKILATDSLGYRTVSTMGECLYSRAKNFIRTTKKTGFCKIIIRIGATKKYSATTSATTIQVNKKVSLNVLAASSLTDAFTQIASSFQSKYLNVSITNSFAGSSTLVTQIQNGAPFDVFASADTTNMDKLITSQNIKAADAKNFAKNKLTILVPRGNPKKIISLSQLTNSSLAVVTCVVSQPCGKYAAQVFTAAGITVASKSQETSVSGVVSKVALGQADAGIGYITDALANEKTLDYVIIPDEQNVVATYPIARSATVAKDRKYAVDAYLSFVSSSSGKLIFTKLGFSLP